MSRVRAAALVCALMASCFTPPDEERGSAGMPRDLSAVAKRGGGKITPERQREGPKRASSVGETRAPVGYMGIGDLEDPSDAAVGYADVTSAALQEDGSNLQVILEMAAGVPDHAPGDSEVVGVAVDLATDKGQFQLFASGENDGWFGYFDTPKGMKPYPGTFLISGSQFVFTVPWSAFGGPRRGRFSVYCEWSSAEGYSEDLAPDNGSKMPFG